MAQDGVYIPPYLRPPAGKTVMARSPSDPQGLLRTTCGLSAHSFLSSSARSIAPTQPLEELRRDATVGYRGFIPGVKAETVFGANMPVVNNVASDIRQLDFRFDKTYDWNGPPDPPQRLRCAADCATWAMWQQDPKYKWMGHEVPRTSGPGLPSYTGHRTLRRSDVRLQSDAAETHILGEHQRLPRQMATDRDCHPVDVIRPAIPGYRGFLPGKKLAA
mmetsp:Transcript_51919/g.116437  ORF Transcript_51919/g.116437 Transcript_51919/m.116437 type:complete len:218 (+) Transcript_51919:57-710(+)